MFDHLQAETKATVARFWINACYDLKVKEMLQKDELPKKLY